MSSMASTPDLSGLPKNTARLLSEILHEGAAFSRQEPGSREKLLELSYALTTDLETIGETISRMGFAEPARHVATYTAIKLKLFEKLTEMEPNPVTVTDLAEYSGAEVPLIARMMKHLVAMNIVAEAGLDQFTTTAVSKALTIPKHRDGITYLFDVVHPSLAKVPAYLASTGYKNPSNSLDGPFQYAHNTKLPFWAYLNEHPDVSERFNSYMGGYREGRTSWMDPTFYPVAERLGHGVKNDKDAVLIVDIGGGLGHDIVEFKAKHPDLPGRLVLQERPEVVQQIKDLKGGIEAMAHDFFTPQPIHGARAYYMHSVLHVLSDTDAVRVLQHLVPALEQSYSKILIQENVVPDERAPWQTTSLDWLMMSLLAGVRERTEREWKALLREAGLTVNGIWAAEVGTECLIEAVLEASSDMSVEGKDVYNAFIG